MERKSLDLNNFPAEKRRSIFIGLLFIVFSIILLILVLVNLVQTAGTY